MLAVIRRHCPQCDTETSFEQPPCVDGHGADCPCPEWLCVCCGTAVLVGVVVPRSGSAGRRAA